MEIALTALYGIGRPLAHIILDTTKIDYAIKTKDLTPEQENLIRKEIESIKTEGDLKREVSSNIKRLKDIGAYRGARLASSLPTKGQRTKSNSRTRRGNVRKTMASGKKKLDKK